MRDTRRNTILIILILVIAAMSVAYAAFSTTLNINGTSTIAGEWNVEITNIASTFTGTASDATAPSHTKNTATFDANLMAPGDTATYTITVTNKGTIDASLSNITLTPQSAGSDAIIYTVKQKPTASDILTAGSTSTVVIEAKYDPATTTIPDNLTKTFTGVLEYVQST